MAIVSISGLIGSGKDTVADYLVSEYGFKKDSFASTVKDVLAPIFGWDRNLLEGSTKASREWRQQVDEWWAKKLVLPHFTPRWAMQHIGTDVFRAHFNDNLWVYALERRLSETSGSIVVSDARYPNELAMLKSLGATLLCVERGELPDWYQWAYTYNKMTDEQAKMTKRIIADLPTAEPNPLRSRIHTSEWAWVGTNFDLTIENDSTINDLYNTVSSSLTLSALSQVGN